MRAIGIISFSCLTQALPPATSHQLAARPKEPPFFEGGLRPQLKWLFDRINSDNRGRA